MSKRAGFTVRTDAKVKKRLEKIASSQDRPLNYVVNEALEAYLDYWQWSVDHIEQGLSEALRGEGEDHDKVFAARQAKLKKRLAKT